MDSRWTVGYGIQDRITTEQACTALSIDAAVGVCRVRTHTVLSATRTPAHWLTLVPSPPDKLRSARTDHGRGPSRGSHVGSLFPSCGSVDTPSDTRTTCRERHPTPTDPFEPHPRPTPFVIWASGSSSWLKIEQRCGEILFSPTPACSRHVLFWRVRASLSHARSGGGPRLPISSRSGPSARKRRRVEPK